VVRAKEGGGGGGRRGKEGRELKGTIKMQKRRREGKMASLQTGRGAEEKKGVSPLEGRERQIRASRET